MTRTFDILNGDIPNEVVAGAVEEAAQSELDLAALVSRLNDIDARINKLEESLNKSLTSQVEAPAVAEQASAEPEAEVVTENTETADIKEENE